MNKILYVCTNSDFTGAPRHTASLINFFSKNFEVRGIFGGQGEIKKILQNQNTEVISELQSKINIKKDWRSFLKLRQSINKFKPDIVHVHSFKASLLIRCICMFSSIKVIYTVHGWPWRGKNFLVASLSYILEVMFAIFDKSTNYVFVDPFSKSFWPIRLFVSKKKLILNGIESPNIDSKIYTKQQDTPNFMFVSRVSPGKRHDIAIKAFELYCKNGGSGSLHFIGENTNSENFLNLFEKLSNHSKDYVYFHGAISQLEKIYSIGDVVILISDFEAMPLSLIEGLSYQKPLIASDVGGVYEIVDESNGILLSKNSIKETYKAFKAMESKIDRVNLSKNARLKYEEKFCIEKMHSKLQPLYES